MFKVEVLGNLGADAMIKGEAGKQFISFNVAHTDKWTDEAGTVHEQTQWVQCIINGTQAKVLPYLVKGKTVYVRGDARLRVYSSEKERRMVAGVTVNVRDLELVGGSSDLIPRELNDEKGELFHVYKAYYIDPSINNKPTNLLDKQMNHYSVDANGFISRVADPALQSGDAQPSADKEQKEDLPFD